MIQFYAQMYDVTTDTLIDSTSKVYSIGEYKGYIDTSSEMGQDILFDKDGQIINTLPQSAIVFNSSTNIGKFFAQYAKQFFAQTGNWHTLRLLKTSSKNDNYLEWSPGAPTGFNIKVDGAISRWDTCYQWSDTDDYDCMVFIKAANTADLLRVEIHYSGGYLLHTSTVQGGTTIVGKSTSNFECDLPRFTTTKTAFDQDFKLNSGNTYAYKASARVTGDPFEYYIALIESVKQENEVWSIACFVFTATNPYGAVVFDYIDEGRPGTVNLSFNSDWNCYYEYQRVCTTTTKWILTNETPFDIKDIQPIVTTTKLKTVNEFMSFISSNYNFRYSLTSKYIYDYLMKSGGSIPTHEPDSDVDPDDIPPEDTPPDPVTPDNPDPYVDPRDPDDPSDPGNPDKQPTAPSDGDPENPPQQADPVTPPEIPPSHAIDSHFVTLYSPSLAQLNSLAQYLWSSSWSVDSFKKILANPMDCILGLMIFPALVAPSGTKNIYVGNLDTGISMSYITNQYVDLNCGSFKLEEYYKSYLDYDPYTKVEIYLPYIGMQTLSADDVMDKTINLKYRIDLLSSACVAFLVVDGTTLYQFSGSCGTSIPVSGTDWSNMVNGILSVAGFVGAAVATGGASMSVGGGLAAASSLAVSSLKPNIRHGGSVASASGLMSIQKPYLIVTRPRQAVALNQNSYQGYPSHITQSLGSCVGYTEVEECHLENVPATGEEVKEIERLLKEGVLF